MIRKIFTLAALSLSFAISGFASQEPGSDFLSDLLGKVSKSVDAGTVVKDVIAGVFTKDDLTVEDIAGTWQSTGSAVDFRSENLLQKAGGLAVTSAIQQKIDPYYKKYGFDKSVITIDKDGNISIKVGKYNLSGTIKPNDKEHYAGNFIVTFKALGVMSLGEYDTYVTLTSNPLTQAKDLKMMFDAQKLVALMKAVAAFSKSSIAGTISSTLDSYDGICVGFQCTQKKK